jgi:hypothetical protein
VRPLFPTEAGASGEMIVQKDRMFRAGRIGAAGQRFLETSI